MVENREKQILEKLKKELNHKIKFTSEKMNEAKKEENRTLEDIWWANCETYKKVLQEIEYLEHFSTI